MHLSRRSGGESSGIPASMHRSGFARYRHPCQERSSDQVKTQLAQGKLRKGGCPLTDKQCEVLSLFKLGCRHSRARPHHSETTCTCRLLRRWPCCGQAGHTGHQDKPKTSVLQQRMTAEMTVGAGCMQHQLFVACKKHASIPAAGATEGELRGDGCPGGPGPKLPTRHH